MKYIFCFNSRHAKAINFFPTESSTNDLLNSREDLNSRNEYTVHASLNFADDGVSQQQNRQNSPPFSFNAGEYYANNGNNHGPDSVRPSSRPTPNRKQFYYSPQLQGNYADYFDYDNNQRPTSFYQGGSPYYPYPVNYQQGYRPQPPGYYQQNYAGNYNSYQGEGNVISNFFSTLSQGASDLLSGNLLGGGAVAPQSPFGAGFIGGRPPTYPQSPYPTQAAGERPLNQFSKAIEEITKNDDLQCIPKIICQMVGNQRRQNTVSPLLGSPIFSA